jgi:GntR family transcriptional regulator
MKSPTRVINEGPRPKHAQLSDVLADLATRELGPDAAIPS